jgi:hypothetical protein
LEELVKVGEEVAEEVAEEGEGSKHQVQVQVQAKKDEAADRAQENAVHAVQNQTAHDPHKKNLYKLISLFIEKLLKDKTSLEFMEL